MDIDVLLENIADIGDNTYVESYDCELDIKNCHKMGFQKAKEILDLVNESNMATEENLNDLKVEILESFKSGAMDACQEYSDNYEDDSIYKNLIAGFVKCLEVHQK